MSLWFYESINEFVEEAIENLKPDLGESHDIQYWMNLIYIAKKKLIDYGNVDPGIAMQEIFSNIKISKEFSLTFGRLNFLFIKSGFLIFFCKNSFLLFR